MPTLKIKAGSKAKPAAPVKPVPAKTATASVKPVAVASKPAKPVSDQPRGLTRDAATVAKQATNYDTYSDRDSAYLRFFGTVCRANGGKATLAQIHNAGVKRTDAPANKRYNPHYSASGKATDAGAIVRQIKAGFFTRSADGATITATDKARSSALYNGKAG